MRGSLLGQNADWPEHDDITPWFWHLVVTRASSVTLRVDRATVMRETIYVNVNVQLD